MARDVWEYRQDMIGGLFRSSGLDRLLVELLNRRGTDGWELAGMSRRWWTRRVELVFKRKIEAQEE